MKGMTIGSPSSFLVASSCINIATILIGCNCTLSLELMILRRRPC